MGLFTRLGGLFRRKMTPEQWFSAYYPQMTAAGIRVNQRTAMQASAVMACVSIRSEDLAKLPLHVYREGSDGGKVIVADHPVERLFQKPNRWQTRLEFVEQLQANYLLHSNAYAAIRRDGRGRPIELIPINSARVVVLEATTGQLFYRVQRRTYHEIAMLAGMPDPIPDDDMLHLRGLMLDGVLGLSRIGIAREAIALALIQQEQASRFAANGMQPSIALKMTKPLDEPARERLREDLKNRFQGPENAGKVPLLPPDIDIEKLGLTLSDAEFLASREFQVGEIGRHFRMPPHKLGLIDKAAAASIPQAEQDYWNNVVTSDAERFEAKANDSLGLTDDGVFAEFDIWRYLRADMQTRFIAYRTGIVGSFMTPNQARRAEGWSDVKGGNVLLQPTNVAELGFKPKGSETGPGSDVTGAPAAGGDGDPAAVPPVGE